MKRNTLITLEEEDMEILEEASSLIVRLLNSMTNDETEKCAIENPYDCSVSHWTFKELDDLNNMLESF